MHSEFLIFTIFLLIGLEIRKGLKHPRELLYPSLCALAGMIMPAVLYISINPHSNIWAVSMPTDVTLALGALSLLRNKAISKIRLFLLTLAIADDFFSLIIIAIFFHNKLQLTSAFNTLGAASIGLVLPFGNLIIKWLSPVTAFFIIPIYIWINLLSKISFSDSINRISLSLVIARVLGKVLGITAMAYFLNKKRFITRSPEINLRQVSGVGFLAGMGLTVSIVIAEITVKSEIEISQVRMGLFIAAIISGVLGLITLRKSA